jgi:hypothetical protein
VRECVLQHTFARNIVTRAYVVRRRQSHATGSTRLRARATRSRTTDAPATVTTSPHRIDVSTIVCPVVRTACRPFVCLMDSTACPIGSIVAKDAANRVSACTAVGGVGPATGCPTGYTCVGSTILGQNVCCGTGMANGGNEKHAPPSHICNHLDVCPSLSAPFINSLTLQPQQCQVNVVGTCSPGYFCWYAQSAAISGSAYFCCKDAVAQPTISSDCRVAQLCPHRC